LRFDAATTYGTQAGMEHPVKTKRAGTAFGQAQRTENRRRLIEAAGTVFKRDGYAATAIETIAAEAGVSRATFYRHFDGKYAVGRLFVQTQHALALDLWSQLKEGPAHDFDAVCSWLSGIFAFQTERADVSRIYSELWQSEPEFHAQGTGFFEAAIAKLGESIVAFARITGSSSNASALRAEAWIMVCAIVEQANLAATRLPPMRGTLLIEALARQFVNLVEAGDKLPPTDSEIATVPDLLPGANVWSGNHSYQS
jgi:AcrR family transcriptional regulator